MDSAEISGRMLPIDTPTWQPLLDFAPEEIEDFMWMFDVELADGTRLHAYKHWWTRRYVHLADDGRAFYYVWVDAETYSETEEGTYRETCPRCHLELVLQGARRMKESMPGYTEAHGEGDGLDAR